MVDPAILVVEDEPMILLDTVDMLEDAGLITLEASNADRALAILEKRGDIAVMFSDIDMPGAMDGLGLAAAVRTRWPHVRIILTSGHMRPTSHDLPAGSVFFSKPYDRREILAQIRQLLAAG